MLMNIGIGLLVLVAGFLGWVALKSPDYVIVRELAIQAPPAKIFPYLDSARRANEWMPWAEVDPGVQMQFSGPDSGVGSKASWDSKGQLGTGSATIVEVQPLQRVALQLDYVKPMAMTQVAEYLVRTEGAATVVTWKVSGRNTFLGRLMCSFFNMDKMVGGSFEKGLAKLRVLAEAR